jgi:hypothetical protein
MATDLRERVAALLDNAAGIIETDGLTKGSLARFDPRTNRERVCSIGALRKANTGNALGLARDCDLEAYQYAANALLNHIGDNFIKDVRPGGGVSIAKWNDRPNRKPSTIIKAFRDAAAKVREGVIPVA